MKLSQKQIKYLKALGHHLKPVVSVGKEGVSPGVLSELAATLQCHELVKVRINADERDDFYALVDVIEASAQAVLVQKIGRIAIFYRENRDADRDQKKRPKIVLPSA